MDSKFIKLNLFTADPSFSQATKEWKYWYKTFTNFLASFPAEPAITNESKLRYLIEHIDKDVYELISEYANYDQAIQTLERVYVKPSNIIFARHLLMSCKQETGQTVDEYLQKLKRTSKDCNYSAVDAKAHKNEAVREAFTMDLSSSSICLKLLENIGDEAVKLDAIIKLEH